MHRRLVVALLLGGVVGGAARLAANGPAEIRIGAKKFEFHPHKVTARLGQPIVRVLTTEDRLHGFKMPDLGIRADIAPGQETRVPLTPGKVGSFAFLCDVFCGDGHEDMEGVLVVEA
ncbi:MAG: cupredoxin domain-containing protein [Burkholderiales bacterium]|nr:cupredoxin domain-containing protein [Burkholderiales bacterium]